MRGIVESHYGTRIFIRPAHCMCDKCPRVDLTQANLHTDIDKIAVGDKVETIGGSVWHRVDEFTPGPEDKIDEFLKAVFSQNAGHEQDVHDALFGGVDGFGPPPAQRKLN